MGWFNRRFVVRGIAVAAMATAVAASVGGAAQAVPVRDHHFTLDAGEDVGIRGYLFGPTKICVERDDEKPGDVGQLGLAVRGVPAPTPTLLVDDQHPESCTEFNANGRTVTATNLSDVELEVTLD